MAINLGNCEYDLTRIGLRLLRDNIHTEWWADGLNEKSQFNDPY